MPFYEYKCQACGAKFEAMLPMSTRDAAEKELECPKCGARAPRRLISSFSTAPSPGSSGNAPQCNYQGG